MINTRAGILACVVMLCACGEPACAQSVKREDLTAKPSIRLQVQTDKEKYSLGDNIKISASLVNAGDSDIYIDRRMLWTGLGGGLALYVADDHGNQVPTHVLSDAMMPPPPPNDTSVLVRLEPGFFYGTSIGLILRGFIKKPGRYSIRVTYQSMLPKDSVASEFRELPALWNDTPSISSKPIWIDVER